jgi:subtilisin family serine protease
MFTRRAAGRFAAMVLLGSVIAGGWGCPARQVPSPSGPVEGEGPGKLGGEDFFYGLEGRRVPLSIRSDQVGIVVHERVRAEAVRQLAEAARLKVLRELSGGFFILGLESPLPREELVVLARKLERDGQQVVRAAGLVLVVQNDPNPQLMTDSLQVGLKRDVDQRKVEDLANSLDTELVRPEPYSKTQFIFRVKDSSKLDSLKVANQLQESGLVEYAHPELWMMMDLTETLFADPLFNNQWHHRNTGASSGTVDADADTSMAWDLTQGAPATLIGVVDNTFDIAHEDLAGNLFTNPGEVASNGVDDDGNGLVDDVNGWDFVGNDNDPRPVGNGDNHGTAVTGVAAARAGNALGGAGACPNCRFVPLTIFSGCTVGANTCVSSTAAQSGAINYAAGVGASAINNSWGTTSPAAAAAPAVVTAINNAVAAGSVVVFSGGNQSTAGWCGAAYPSLANVLSVSSSSNQDRKVIGHAFGNCIDVLAPTRFSPADPTPTGTLAITTTDRTGANGYNNTDPQCIAGLTEPGNTNYTNCFSGTSSAAPLTSGAIGLVRTANTGLTPVQVQRLIQDTTDKIEDSVGAYSTLSGFSSPASGVATHSWGRLNAFEAVRVVAPAPQGKAGVDILLRDNRLDWGNTEQPSNTLFEPTRGFIPHWQSVDIKVDAPPFEPAPVTNAGFEALTDNDPKEGQINKVYVRVRNRGPVPASAVTVKLHWAYAGLGLPALPGDFWPSFPADSSDTTQWHPLGVQPLTNLVYSGSSVAGCPGRVQPACPGVPDPVQITSFDFTGPPVPASQPNHFCLMAVIDSPQDPVSAASRASLVVDAITPTDNNVTHRNVRIEPAAGGSGELIERFFVRNPFRESARVTVRLNAPRQIRAKLEGFALNEPQPLKAGAQVLVTLRLEAPALEKPAEVHVIEEMQSGNQRVIGGMTYVFDPSRKPEK